MPIALEKLASRRELEANINPRLTVGALRNPKASRAKTLIHLRPFVPAVTPPNRKESLCRNPPPPC
ncbi:MULTISPECIES: hypothetical protein [unclassified Mesorhizobium]|uniref:hypothetical protein n=1 Tax=unclassified Mesorhizobium TaxID=325217 RepID=UPI00112E7F0C|nr:MULTISPECIES: hypothetical protein [unclassified Mesorhizobium]TPL11406.1 hypothetical protein FJ952_26190 [Mesorhizobium sp. B2-4-10]TPM12656.1 hypothetical protein FJ953_29195 [Mesorhizobium sp. B2-3-6]TPN67937.1 hypothetical protein FJ986_08345 [Mesorhizobium sp. B1-1-1]